MRPPIWVNRYLILCGCLVVFRNGLNYWGYDYYALSWAADWPLPKSVFSVENFGDIALAHIIGIDTRFGWALLHVLLTAFFFLLLIFYINREKLNIGVKSDFFLLILASPISMMLMQEIGYFDVITIIGALVLACSSSLFGIFLGTLIMSAGNSPQALVAIFLLSVISAYLSEAYSRRTLVKFLPFFLACIIWLLERIWLNGVGRTEEFGPGMWVYSFKGFLIASPLFLYSLIGPLIILVPKIIGRTGCSSKSKDFQSYVACIFVSGIFGIITTESTRDALCIMAPSLFWLVRREFLEFGFSLSKWERLGLCILPCFLIWREGSVVEPWNILHRIFF
jgi:hypothetical protein